MYARTNRCYNERRLRAWKGLTLNTYISVYARTNGCYNERGSRTNYVHSSILHSTASSPQEARPYIRDSEPKPQMQHSPLYFLHMGISLWYEATHSLPSLNQFKNV